MSIPASIIRLKPGAIVTLFDLDLSKWNGGTFRFVPGTLGDGQVSWRGQSYMPVPAKAEGFEKSGSGTLPTPKLAVGKVDFIAAAVRSFDHLRGARVIRWRTFKKHLDGQVEANPDWYWPLDVFYISRKLSENGPHIVWELAASTDLRNTQIPGRVATRDGCQWTYRVWNGTRFDHTNVMCPYQGAAMFNEADQPVNNPAEDNCSRHFSGCVKRFGAVAALPFGAFPGMGLANY